MWSILINFAVSVIAGSSWSATASAPATEPIPITVQNAHRLKLFMRKEISGPAIGLFAADPICTIGEVTADSKTNKVYLYRQAYTELQGGQECGIYIYDVKGFRQIKYIPISPDTHGKTNWRKRYIPCTGWFDLTFNHFIVGADEFFDLETGDGTPIEGLPYHKCWQAPDLIVNKDTILYKDRVSPVSDKGIYLLDREKLDVLKHLPLPPANKDVQILGAIDEHVLGWTTFQKPSNQLLIFRMAEAALELVNTIDLDEYYVARNIAFDREHHRCAIVEAVQGHGDDNRRRLRIYDIPSLKVLREFPDKFGRPLFVPSAPILLVSANDRLSLIHIDSGEVLKELKLSAFGMIDRDGGWKPFVDPHGCWIGVYGCTWLQLFRVEQ